MQLIILNSATFKLGKITFDIQYSNKFLINNHCNDTLINCTYNWHGLNRPSSVRPSKQFHLYETKPWTFRASLPQSGSSPHPNTKIINNHHRNAILTCKISYPLSKRTSPIWIIDFLLDFPVPMPPDWGTRPRNFPRVNLPVWPEKVVPPLVIWMPETDWLSLSLSRFRCSSFRVSKARVCVAEFRSRASEWW